MEERLQICLTITAMLFVTCSWSQVNPDIKDCLPPSIKKQAGKATRYFFGGLTLEIPCIARGGGKLTYTWLKDGAPLDLNSPDIQDRAAMSSGVGTLTLAALEKDEGIYQCSVTNECGTSLSEKTPVKLARMDTFPLSDKPVELKRVQGTSLILTCNPPESVPKPKITWIIRVSRNYLDITDDTPGFSTVQMDRRITMDYNGNLYITSVRKEDEQGGNTYVCQVENRFIRSVTLGADKRISVNDTTMSEMGVELMWYSDTEALVMHGKNARFKCIFSGQPEPTISWTKVIGSYDKTRTSFDDHEMIISNVSYSDAGEYRCMARNQLSKDLVSHTFTLTVEALPKWKNKPHEVVVGVGENATFDCGADGMPKPTIEWFINGRPYAEIPENPNRVLKDDVLSFSNLEKDDSQVIQCNASNVHGFLWSDVYLYVQDCLPPSIKKQAGKATRYFFDGLTLEIQCIARGGGKLTYTWLKDGAPLDLNSPDIQDRAAMSSGVGTLTLAALEKDEGIYQCSVTNECGTSLSEKTPVKLARMDPFPLSDKPVELKRVQGTSLILTCNPPESVPKPKITWIIRVSRNYLDITDDTPGFSTVQMDRRITMDYNGNLYITSVRKEDEQGGNTYVCQVENRFIRSVTLGADKRISVNDTTMSEMGVELMWYSDTEALVMHGMPGSSASSLDSKYTGQPEPTISWTKVIGSYDKTRTSFDDHEMIISNVSYSDAGEYRCMARNQLSKDLVSHTFTLTVEALPKWKNKPHEVVVGVGENATFDCGADGMPKPTIEWFINGRPYAEIPENPNRVLKDDVLSFSNLEKDDSQVIQCNASNVHGFLWSDVYLYVQALPPTIVVKPANETVVAENQDLIVSCQVTGKPKPSLTWYKGNQQLLSDKFVVLDTGNLLIKKTEKKDPGMYRSFAQNKFGEASASGKVNVRDQTRIGTRPIDSKVDYTNSVMCTCGATTDPMESTKLRIRWLKDGVEVKPSNRVFINGGVLSINETNSKDTGNYTCIAENGLDNYTATAKLEVIAVPDPPYNVSLKDCLATKATIEWKFDEKMSNFETMIRFIVEYNTEYKPGVWVEMVSTDYPTNRATVDLSPFAKYKFRVKAVNRMGTSEASEPTRNSCLTLMSVPDKNPDNVHTDESYTGFLVVKWNPVEQIDHNGPSFRYVVQVQEKGTKYFQTFEVNDYTTTEKHIPVNTIFRPYYITVRSENQVGKASNKPVTYTGYSGEAPPLVIPDNFELDPDVNVTATSAGFRWDPVDTNPEVIRGEFSGYKIRFWKVDEKETTLHEHIISPEPSNRNRKRRNSPDGKIRGTIANLPSYADIEADVVVINRNFESNGSNIVNFSTPEGVPGRVAFLKATYKGSHHFVLQWGIPTKPNGIITSYQMSYQKISRLGVGPKIIAYEDIEPEVYQVELKDLEPESQYRVSIMAKTAEGLGEEFYIDVKTISDVSGYRAMALTMSDNITSNKKEEPTLAVQEKERLRGTYADENPDHFDDYGKGDENGIKGSGSFHQDAEKVPLDEDVDSLDYGDDEGSKFNEDGSFIGQYGHGEKENETNASSIV